MTRFEYLGDRYAGVNVEHNIGSGLFRYTGITRKLKWRQFWTAKTLWSSLNEENTALNNSMGTFKTLNNNPYMEIGTGIDNILHVLRVDFVWRVLPATLDKKGDHAFGVFGSFRLSF